MTTLAPEVTDAPDPTAPRTDTDRPTTGDRTADRATGVLPTGRARTIALFSLFLASTMELLDTTIVNVALPTIERSLGASGAQLQWMVAAYPLAFAVALITGSRMGDLWGRKRLFVVGLVAFTAHVGGVRPRAVTRGARAASGPCRDWPPPR